MKRPNDTTLFVFDTSGMGSFPMTGPVNNNERNRAVLGPGPFGGTVGLGGQRIEPVVCARMKHLDFVSSFFF
jgi:hypothetical protein